MSPLELGLLDDLFHHNEALVLALDDLGLRQLVPREKHEVRRVSPHALVLGNAELDVLNAILGATLAEEFPQFRRIRLGGDPLGLLLDAFVDLTEERLVRGYAGKTQGGSLGFNSRTICSISPFFCTTLKRSKASRRSSSSSSCPDRTAKRIGLARTTSYSRAVSSISSRQSSEPHSQMSGSILGEVDVPTLLTIASFAERNVTSFRARRSSRLGMSEPVPDARGRNPRPNARKCVRARSFAPGPCSVPRPSSARATERRRRGGTGGERWPLSRAVGTGEFYVSLAPRTSVSGRRVLPALHERAPCASSMWRPVYCVSGDASEKAHPPSGNGCAPRPTRGRA